jgi:2',3'-cyclic-nucleotide 2'-phosphodiesterase (5'-nucleotidase family)
VEEKPVPLSIPMRRARRSSLAIAVIAAIALVIPASVVAAKPPPPPATTIQILNVSDWHGNVDPLSLPTGAVVGGAWNISARWAADRLNYPTLTLTAGDDFGASPALVNSFNEEPAVIAERLMGIQVGTFGNHNFDKGTAFLQGKIDLAAAPAGGSTPGNPYPYVATNLKNIEANLTGVDPIKYFKVGGAKVAVIGIVNEEAPTLVFPGNFGTIIPTDGVVAATKFATIARKAGANAVVVITHKGVRGLSPAPFGELVDFARALPAGLVDVVFGDHTDIQYSDTLANGVLVHENKSFGVTYAKTLLDVQPGRGGGVTAKSVTFVTPTAGALTSNNTVCPVAPAYCDQAIVDMLVPYRAALAPILNTQVGSSSKIVPRADQCGTSNGRTCESLIGDTITDALRQTYATDFALTNSGGIRANLTCPVVDISTDFCPAFTPPPYFISRGQVLTALSFGNVSATLTLNGAELKAMLERGVSAMPGVDGRFPQISGFCFTYDISLVVGSRVTGAVRANLDGTCSTTALDLTSGTSYTLATNNFTASGGDGYPNFSSRMTTFNIMDSDVSTWLGAQSPIAPFVLGPPDGRINCTDGNGTGIAPNCPTLTTSP